MLDPQQAQEGIGEEELALPDVDGFTGIGGEP